MSDEAMVSNQPAANGLFGKIRLVLACSLVVLLVFGGYYFFFVQRKYNYLTGRNFRFLAAIGTQLDASLQTRGKMLASLAQKQDLERSLADPKLKRDVMKELASGFEDVRVAPSPGGGTGGSTAFVLQSAGGEPRIDITYTADPEDKRVSLWASLRLRTVAEPIFQSRKAFDAVLLANPAGEVVYRQGSVDLSVTRLDWLLEKSPGYRKGDKATPVDHHKLLLSSSESYDVQINGRDYRLFVEPIPLPLQGLAGSSPDRQKVWLVCGLIPQKEFLYRSLAVSSSLLSSLLGLLILTALSWPFLKLFLISKTQRVSLLDVLLLGLCSVLGVAVATLFVLDSIYFLQLEEISKQQLDAFTDKMEQNLRSEIRAAYPLLTGLEGTMAPGVEHGDKNTRVASLLQEQTSRALFDSTYPFAQTFTLMQGDGSQIYKATVNREVPPLISVRERSYFKQAAAGDVWDLRALDSDVPSAGRPHPGGRPQPFYIEPIVGWTSGTRMAMLSRPVPRQLLQAPDPRVKVSALAIPMVSVINPVLPPGFKFAVIDDGDENGRVLFHSDPERMLTEDFLTETDQDRRLRSAVFARRSETMPVRYWGEDYMARTAPVRGLPWTIVALKDMKILRAVNVDWISTTLLMILLYVGLLAATLVLVAAVRRSYRADWVWPDPQQHWNYRVLSRAYVPLLMGAVLVIWGLRSSSEMLSLAFLLPALAIVMAYLKLQRKPADRPFALAAGSLTLLLFAVFLLRAPLEPESPAWLSWAVLLLVSLSFVLASGLGRREGRGLAPPADAEPPARPEPGAAPVEAPAGRGAGLRWPSVATSYCLAGAFLLLLTAVLPTAGFFKVAHRVHSVSFLRHGQLKLALELKQRAVAAQRTASAVASTPEEKSCLVAQRLAVDPRAALPAHCRLPRDVTGLDVYADAFYQTRVEFPPEGDHDVARECTSEADLEILPDFMEELLPRYSEPASEMRELLHSSASDCIWYWGRDPVKPPYLHTFHSRDYPEGELHLSSPVWALSTGRTEAKEGDQILLSSFGGIVSLPSFLRILSLAGLLCLVWLLVRFVAKRIFLIDLLPPLWSEKEKTGPATIGRNLFLVGRDRGWQEEVKKNFDWIHIKELDDPGKDWSAWRSTLMDSDRVILVEGFEHKFQDQEFNQKKLLFLEELAGMQERTVVVTSRVSPTRLFSRETGNGSSGANELIAQRWRNLLAMFTICEDDLRGVLQRVEASSKIECEALKAECGVHPHLLSIARELDEDVRHLSREQILEEFGERAEGFYRGLWASCSPEEQVVLEHLAEEGLVNEKTRRTLRRLMARGFVRRDPYFRLMNETFRRFVVSNLCKGEVLALEKEAAPSSWDHLRGPLFIGLAASLVFFVATQQELLDGMLASITGLTAGLPAIVKLFDLFGSRGGSKLTAGK